MVENMEYGCEEKGIKSTFEFCYNCAYKMDAEECKAYRKKYGMILTQKKDL